MKWWSRFPGWFSRFDWLFVLFVGLAFAVRVYGLERTELWWDEYLTLNRALMPLGDLLYSLKYQTFNSGHADLSPPLFHVLMHWSLAFGHTELFAKLPSVVFGALSVGVLYLVVQTLFSRWAGVLTATYACMSMFHFQYSREARWYGVFYFFLSLAILGAAKFSSRRSAGSLLLFVIACSGMMYTSYVASVFVVGLFLYLGIVWLTMLARNGWDGQTSSFAKWIVGAAVIIALLYVPQIEGHLVAYKTFFTSFANRFSFYGLYKAIGIFLFGFNEGHSYKLLYALLLVCIAGFVYVVCSESKYQALFLVLCATVPQAVVAYCINVSTDVLPRYQVGLFFLMILVIGTGAWGVGLFVSQLTAGSRANSGRFPFQEVAAASVLVPFLIPITTNSGLYRGAMPQEKVVAQYMLLNKRDHGYLMYSKDRHLKILYDWLCGDAFKKFSMFDRQGYKRFYFLSQGTDAVPSGLANVRSFSLRGGEVFLRKGGIVSTSPVLLTGTDVSGTLFSEDFTSLGYYQTVWESSRVGIDFTMGALTPDGSQESGHALYRFNSSALSRGRGIKLVLAVSHDVQPGFVSDAALTVRAGRDPQQMNVLVSLGQKEYNDLSSRGRASAEGAVNKADLTLPLDDELFAGEDLFLSFDFAPGSFGGRFLLDSFRLTSGEESSLAASRDETAWRILGNVSRNADLKPWSNDVRWIQSDVLHVFDPYAASPIIRDGVQVDSASGLAAYKKRYPHAVPVLVIPGEGNGTRFELYDPSLDEDMVDVAQLRESGFAMTTPAPYEVKGVQTKGPLEFPSVAFDGSSLDFPFYCPGASMCVLNPGERGYVRFTPFFTRDAFYSSVTSFDENVRLSHDGASVTCNSSEPCSFTYRLASKIPVRKVGVIYFPWGSTGTGAQLLISIRINGEGEYVLLDAYSPSGPQPWVGDTTGITSSISFSNEVHVVDFKFKLSGDNMQLRSTEPYPMLVTLEADAASVPTPVIKGVPFGLSVLSGVNKPFRFWFDEKPIPVSDRLDR